MSFDSIAPAYRTLETIAFGGDLQQARVACLDEIELPRRALIVGEGNGRFLCELLRRHPSVVVDCVDASARMLELARRRIEGELPDRVNQINFLPRDISAWSPPGHRFDLIVTHFFLDCFSDTRIAEIVAKLAVAADINAIWLLADFCIPAGGAARLRTALWLSTMYRFFRITAGIEATTLADPSPFLRGTGFALARQHLFRSGMVKSELWRRTS